MQDFKRVLDLKCKLKETEQLNFFNWLSNVKNLVLSNGSEYNVIQLYYNSFFSKKIRKTAQRLGASPPDPASNTFELQYTFYAIRVSQFRHFRILAIGLSPLLEGVPSYVPTLDHGF